MENTLTKNTLESLTDQINQCMFHGFDLAKDDMRIKVINQKHDQSKKYVGTICIKKQDILNYSYADTLRHAVQIGKSIITHDLDCLYPKGIPLDLSKSIYVNFNQLELQDDDLELNEFKWQTNIDYYME